MSMITQVRDLHGLAERLPTDYGLRSLAPTGLRQSTLRLEEIRFQIDY